MGSRVKDKSITRKFMVPILIIMVIETILFACVFLFSGTIRQLNENSFAILSERTTSRKDTLQNQMVQYWSSVDAAQNSIQSKVDDLLQSSGLPASRIDAQTSVNILDQVSGDVISMLREDGVTDAFLILNGDDSSNSKAGIYLRDADPSTNSANNSDLSIERAPSSVTKKLGISLSSYWTPNFELDPDESSDDFYYKPYRAAIQYPDVSSKDLGYWGPPCKFSKDSSVQVVTYTIPLRTADGTVFGVLGTGVSTDYLASLLPYDEINMNKKGAYLLGITRDDSGEIENVVSSGPIAKMLIGTSPTTNIVETASSNDSDIHELAQNERITETVYSSVEPLRLYNSNTPFEGDQWVLLGFMEGKYLLDSSYQVTMMACISAGIAILFALIAVLVVGRRLTRPITSLVHTMQNSNAELQIEFSKTHITEIDHLADAIVSLNQDVEESASKLSQIIQAADIAIGAYEYGGATGNVIITGRFLSLFGREEKARMSIGEFRKLMEELSSYRESTDDHVTIYKILDATGEARWLRLKTISSEGRYMGVLTDITQETLEKRRIEYDRDYDLLTNLLNRRAFHAAVKELFRTPEKLKTAAFMLWDLDNLKFMNDTYGHDCGDEYIKSASNILRHFVPYHNAVVSRMSGDEFYILIYGYDTKDEIRQIISDVKQEMDHAVFRLPNAKETRIRVSAGISWYPDDADDYTELIKYADFAMYTVKNTEKGKIAEFDRELYERDSFLLHSKEELNRLIETKSVRYAFQPIADARTGEIFAYEALMRPISQTLHTPVDVLRIAGSQSKLYEIEKMTLTESLNSYLEFPEAASGRKLFVNTLPSQVLSGQDLLYFENKFRNVLGNVVFEFMEIEKLDEDFTVQKTALIQKWGSQVAIDDYGTGYSTDSMILLLSPDYVKIDMSLIHNIDSDPNRQLLLQNVLLYLKQKDIKVIAEGVETSAELRTLVSYGVDYLQGYYIGMPDSTPIKSSIRAQEIRDLNSN